MSEDKNLDNSSFNDTSLDECDLENVDIMIEYSEHSKCSTVKGRLRSHIAF